MLIIGEPGIGKSRLAGEFRAKLAETSHTWVEWSALQLLQNTPLHPIAEWGRIRFEADAPAVQRLADLENTLALIGLDPAEYAPLLAPLVDIPRPAARAASLPPEELRRRQLEAVVAWVLAGARSQPIALAFEDLQWADPTSLDLMQALAKRGAQAPLLIIASARPEFSPRWSVGSHHSMISLAPLDRADVAQMIGELAARHALSKELVEGVSERTGGMPLFVEEVTRLLLERGEAGRLQAIPPTLQQSLAARLDRLGEAREVAQIGAVLGREFSFALLSAVAGVGDPALQRAPVVDDRGLQSGLDRLVDADLVLVQGAGAPPTYRFKHALIQDAAYEGLLKSRRQALYRRAGEILRDKPESAAAHEAIVHHFTEAGLDDLAIEWWGEAGDQALRRSAFQEAIAHLGKAIAMADKTPGGKSQATATRRLKLQADYGRAVMWSKGFGAAETEAAFARASDLSLQTESRAEQSTVYYARWIRNYARGEMNEARTIAESFLHEAETEGRRMEAAVARRALGATLLFQGEIALARSHIERALADIVPDQEMDARRLFGMDARLVAATYLPLARWLLGDVKYARRVFEGTVGEAHASGHLATLIHTYFVKAVLDVFRDDPTATLDAAEALLKHAKEHNAWLYVAWGEIYSTWARCRALDERTGARGLQQALARYLEQGNAMLAPLHCGLVADLEVIAGRVEDALASVDAGLTLAKKTGEHWTDPLLLRRKGEILLQTSPPNHAHAEESFRTAVAVAKRQGSRSLGLRAALSLAKLNQSTFRQAEARAVLARARRFFADARNARDRRGAGADGAFGVGRSGR